MLSPVGINVRASPGSSAPVLGSASQGTVLTVLGYTGDGGGWFKVKGATVTGWISSDPALSAAGEFRGFTSSEFAALYPADWNEATMPGSAQEPTTTTTTTPGGPPGGSPAAPSSVYFRPASGAGDIVATSAGSVTQLPHGRAGYGRTNVTQVVVCGATAGLVVFKQTAGSGTTSPGTSVPESLTYLAEVRFAVDNQHALGFYADMPDLGATFDIFKEVLASVTFDSPQCSG